MSNIVFLAPVGSTEVGVGAAGVTYGAGHQMDLAGDIPEANLRVMQRQGKVALQHCEIRNVRVTARGTTTATIAFSLDQPSTNIYCYYGLTTNPATVSSAATTTGPPNGPGDFTINLTGLTTGTLYYYRPMAYNNPSALYYTTTPVYNFTTL